MEPTPIFALLTDVATGAHADGAHSVLDLIRAVEASPAHADPARTDRRPVDEPRVGHVPGVLSFRLPA